MCVFMHLIQAVFAITISEVDMSFLKGHSHMNKNGKPTLKTLGVSFERSRPGGGREGLINSHAA